MMVSTVSNNALFWQSLNTTEISAYSTAILNNANEVTTHQPLKSDKQQSANKKKEEDILEFKQPAITEYMDVVIKPKWQQVIPHAHTTHIAYISHLKTKQNKTKSKGILTNHYLDPKKTAIDVFCLCKV